MSEHYFISDAHLGAAPVESEAKLVRFLAGLEGRADTLWILGDLFDFWFEYRWTIPKHGFRVLTALGRLRQAGTTITCLAGNHDLRMAGFFERALGVETAARVRVTLDGRRVLMRHGHEIDRRTIPRFFRLLMNSRLNNALYRLIHPDLGIALAGWVARRSRYRPPDTRLAGRMRGYARKCLEQGNDMVIFGHLHRPELVEFPEGSYLNTGDWLGNYSYGVLRDGVLSLEKFDG